MACGRPVPLCDPRTPHTTLLVTPLAKRTKEMNMKPNVHVPDACRALLIIAAGVLAPAAPLAARPITAVNLSVPLTEDQTCPCNCSTGHCTFASVLDSVPI